MRQVRQKEFSKNIDRDQHDNKSVCLKIMYIEGDMLNVVAFDRQSEHSDVQLSCTSFQIVFSLLGSAGTAGFLDSLLTDLNVANKSWNGSRTAFVTTVNSASE